MSPAPLRMFTFVVVQLLVGVVGAFRNNTTSSTTDDDDDVVPVEQRILQQLTLEEKMRFLGGAFPSPPWKRETYTGVIRGVERNDNSLVPALLMNDGPQGFRARDDNSGTTTSFPSNEAVSASFDPDLVYKYAKAIAREFRRKGSNVLLGPGLNVQRVARNGRNFEYLYTV